MSNVNQHAESPASYVPCARSATCENIRGLSDALTSSPSLATYQANHGSLSQRLHMEPYQESWAARSLDMIIGEARGVPAHNGSCYAERQQAAVEIIRHIYATLGARYRKQWPGIPEANIPHNLGFGAGFERFL